jgi:hypothetical protein
MADFDTNYWGGGAYTPTDYGMSSPAPNWAPQAVDWSGNYSQPNYYDQYAGYAPDWGSAGAGYDSGWGGFSPEMQATAGGGGGLSSVFGGISNWLGSPSGEEGSASNGSKLAGQAITMGGGALLGIMQAKALEKANKKKAKQDAERAKNAGKLAGQQRLDYLNTLRQDPRFREFTVSAPDRPVINASGDPRAYGQTGGEHQYFDPEYLSKVTATPVPMASGGLAMANAPQQAMQPPQLGLGDYVKFLMNGKRTPQNMAQGTMPPPQQMAGGGLSKLISGAGGGQDDLIDAKLSPGEYVMDAETVSALGDGSSEAGAKRLDKMRQNLRTHKRAAPKTKIPPKAKDIEGYM